jgi:hypothetical protein
MLEIFTYVAVGSSIVSVAMLDPSRMKSFETVPSTSCNFNV